MARRKQSRGDCAYCGREMTRGGLARHLRTCSKRREAIAAADSKLGRSQTLYHLQVQDAWSGYYWLHLEMQGNATLKDLDSYLRAIWLECCGHLSAFEIDNVRYTQLFNGGWSWGVERSMNMKVRKLFRPGMQIHYEYDFGTTSELLIKVVDQRQGKPTTPHPIALMARNKLDPVPCIECGQPASYLCVQCLYERVDSRCELCEDHAATHECSDYGEPLPIFNSPRVGMCGYAGPAEPPY